MGSAGDHKAMTVHSSPTDTNQSAQLLPFSSSGPLIGSQWPTPKFENDDQTVLFGPFLLFLSSSAESQVGVIKDFAAA